MASVSSSERSPLLGLRFVRKDARTLTGGTNTAELNEQRKGMAWILFLLSSCAMAVFTLRAFHSQIYNEYEELAVGAERFISSLEGRKEQPTTPAYAKVQTLSFQIYTGGAPAVVVDETTGLEKKNHECKDHERFGMPEDSDAFQCYLGLEDAAEDVNRRLRIMTNAVDRAYDVSDKDDSVLKIFIAPEFYFRGLNGAYEFLTEEEEDADGCSDICHILKGLENLVADKRFENWMFLFGTVIASEALPLEDTFDYQFYNFAPLYKGFDPASSKGVGKRFLVPKRYVSNIDFLTPMRDLLNSTDAMELLDEKDNLALTLDNPHASGRKKYDSAIWTSYKDELATLGYTMIEYGWLFLDGVSFSVEICLDHLIHRALQTYLADVVTGSKVRIPSSANDSIEWVGIPKQQAQVSLVSSAGMDVTVESLALADGGHIFLQDGMDGDVEPHTTYGEDECRPNTNEFFGGSQSVRRNAVVSANDVTFDYVMNMKFLDYDLYPNEDWQRNVRGVFSTTRYPPRLTVYDPVDIANV